MHCLYVETLFNFGERAENQMRRRDDVQYFVHDHKIMLRLQRSHYVSTFNVHINVYSNSSRKEITNLKTQQYNNNI